MFVEKFEIFLALLAGLVLLVMGIFWDLGLSEILLRVLIGLAVFYIIGLAVKTYLRKRIFFDKPEGEAESGEENAENLDEPQESDNSANYPPLP